MKLDKKLIKKISAGLIIAFPILIFWSGAFIFKQKYLPKTKDEPIIYEQGESEEEKEEIVKLIVESGEEEKEEYEIVYKEDETAFMLLERLQEQDGSFSFEYEEYGEAGNMITTINEITPDEDSFWEFFINNEESPVGVSSYKVEKEDELKFEIDIIDNYGNDE
ncbi:DUF4430 domain-containing protein [Candidatus Dojkabacteria bacterium]|nr:DUF4430 domain-containing protein [Candidatus Dojkabacteria bacterium]